MAYYHGILFFMILTITITTVIDYGSATNTADHPSLARWPAVVWIAAVAEVFVFAFYMSSFACVCGLQVLAFPGLFFFLLVAKNLVNI